MKYITLLFAVFLLIGSISNATTATVTAQQGTGVSNLAGEPLFGTQVDLGYYDGSFNLLEPAAATTGNPLPVGLFGGAVSFDSNSKVCPNAWLFR